VQGFRGELDGGLRLLYLGSPTKLGRGEVKGNGGHKSAGFPWQVGCLGMPGQVAHLATCRFENGEILPIACLMK
jgi:hypothetical protein